MFRFAYHVHACCGVFGRFLAHGWQIEDLTGINKDDNEVTVMEASLDRASKDMVNLVNRRDQELKVGDIMNLRQESTPLSRT